MFNSTVFASEGVCVCLASHRASWPGNAHARTIWIRVKMYCFTSLISRARARAMRLSMLAPELYISYTYVRMLCIRFGVVGFFVIRCSAYPTSSVCCASEIRNEPPSGQFAVRLGSLATRRDAAVHTFEMRVKPNNYSISEKNTVQLQLKSQHIAIITTFVWTEK